MPLQILDTSQPEFEPLYARFVEEASTATFWYLPRWRQYMTAYCDGAFVADRSFAVLVDGDVVGVCPVIVEASSGAIRIAIRGSFTAGPLIAPGLPRRTRRKILDSAFQRIDSIAAEHGVSKAMLSAPFCGELTMSSAFGEQQFLEAPASTHVADLSVPLKELWSDVRGSYHSIINKAKRRLRVVIMDSNTLSPELHEAYRLLHHKAAGRVTRPLRTFELQYEMVTEDNAAMVALLADDTPIACTYFHHHHGMVYLASIADDHEFEAGVPLEHLAIWSGIEYYKSRNFRFMELGYQQHGPQLFDPASIKDVSISFFKRGFPGQSFLVPRGVRYYRTDAAREDLTKSCAALLDAVLPANAVDGHSVPSAGR